jgi:hypothetical protein
LLDEAMERLCTVPKDDPVRRVAALDRVAALFTEPGIGRAALEAGSELAHALWHAGWQPIDLVRIARRELKPRHSRLTADLIAADHRSYPDSRLSGRWATQLAEIGARTAWTDDDRYLEHAAAREKCTPVDLGRTFAELLALLSGLPELPRLSPAPCETPRTAATAVPDGVPLERIRALLTKAESSDYPEESEALTAKAQQLMAQYSIDTALLAARTGNPEAPGGVRVPVDAPYEEPKALLLQAVAGANRCRTVWSKQLGFSTIIGFSADAEAAEMLYTSLLVQAQAGLQTAGARTRSDGASRTRAFRQSFLLAYATRIQARLSRTAQEVTAEAVESTGDQAGGVALLPVLASRAEAVDEHVDELFGDLTRTSSALRAQDQEGWRHGTAAADRARLHRQAEALA